MSETTSTTAEILQAKERAENGIRKYSVKFTSVQSEIYLASTRNVKSDPDDVRYPIRRMISHAKGAPVVYSANELEILHGDFDLIRRKAEMGKVLRPMYRDVYRGEVRAAKNAMIRIERAMPIRGN